MNPDGRDLILAWQSEHARKKAIANHGHKAKQYEDRPIREPYWNRKRDHPIPGLAHYKIPKKIEAHDGSD